MENFENLSFADSIVMQCFVVHVETCFSFVEAWQWFICILPAKKNPYRLHIATTRRCTLGDRAFPVAAARAWNSLPLTVTSQTSLLTFRRPQPPHIRQKVSPPE